MAVQSYCTSRFVRRLVTIRGHIACVINQSHESHLSMVMSPWVEIVGNLHELLWKQWWVVCSICKPWYKTASPLALLIKAADCYLSRLFRHKWPDGWLESCDYILLSLAVTGVTKGRVFVWQTVVVCMNPFVR